MAAPKSRTLVKKAMQDVLMHGMKTAIAYLPENAVEERMVAEEQFRRVEKLFGYEPNSWPVGV
jgi:AMMECR1 domain-containing protein